jgi:MYXO-CTERM domain-containing protein
MPAKPCGRRTFPPLALVAALLGGQATAQPDWSAPVSLGLGHGRLAVGNRLHAVGHLGGNLVHRSSGDDGATWSADTVIAPAAGNFPMQYGGLTAQGDGVYLITAAGDMGGAVQHLDFRRSLDNGATWSSPVRLTLASNQRARRANIVVSGNHVHVTGGAGNPNDVARYRWYFRSVNGGLDWDPPYLVDDGEGGDGWIAVDGSTVHIAYDRAPGGGGGRTHYLRSTDSGATWTAPVFIGESSAQSALQARTRLAAAGGRVFVVWQREGPPPPAERLGFNRSDDGGATWSGPAVFPGDPGVDRNHQHIFMRPGGATHLTWLHGAPGQGTSYAGYRLSLDFGVTWGATENANPAAAGVVVANIVADDRWVHVGVDPRFALQHVRREVPIPPDPGDAGTPDAGGEPADAGADTDAGSGMADAGAGAADGGVGSGDDGGVQVDRGQPEVPAGCGCASPGATAPGALLWLGLALWAVSRRRYRTR